MKTRFLALFLLSAACSTDSTGSAAFDLNGNWQTNFNLTLANNTQDVGHPPMHIVQNGTNISGTMDDDSPSHAASQPFTGSLHGSTLTVSGIPPGCLNGHYSFTANVVSSTSITITSGSGIDCQDNGVTIGFTVTSGTMTKL